jgi:hypothetical protein
MIPQLKCSHMQSKNSYPGKKEKIPMMTNGGFEAIHTKVKGEK